MPARSPTERLRTRTERAQRRRSAAWTSCHQPVFSTRETIGDEAILRRYNLGHVWARNEEGHFVNTGAVRAGGVPPEVLFLGRAWHWAKTGTGRIAILLPDGPLGNPGAEYVRSWILRQCEVLASVDLPVESF